MSIFVSVLDPDLSPVNLPPVLFFSWVDSPNGDNRKKLNPNVPLYHKTNSTCKVHWKYKQLKLQIKNKNIFPNKTQTITFFDTKDLHLKTNNCILNSESPSHTRTKRQKRYLIQLHIWRNFGEKPKLRFNFKKKIDLNWKHWLVQSSLK